MIYPNVSQVDLIYSLIDGSFVNTRPEEYHNEYNWRECKMGMVFEPQGLKKRKPGKNGEERYTIEKSDYCAFIGSKDDFKYVFLDMVLRNGVRRGTKVVFLSDGADWIDKLVHFVFDPIGATVIAIIDLFHTKENIGKFCLYVNTTFNKSSRKSGLSEADGKCQVDEPPLLSADEIIHLVEEGNLDGALNILEPYKDIKIPGVVNAYNYIFERMDK